ncbi:hypothetical protein LZ554_006740 [Drepanopeziza brunnea f. sp. 'monogermtubi']|nr:hypothetical protein LZ554_006740 [Drepanopeziza brunnea f. sp. 'monogermtubi']
MSRPRLIGLPNHPDFDPVVLAAIEREWLLHAASEKLHTRWVAAYNQEGRMVNVTRQLEGVRTSTADKAGPMDPETNLFKYYAKPHLRILTVEDMAEAIYKHWLDRPDRQTIDPFYRMINRTYDGSRKEDATWLVRQIKEKTKEINDGFLRNRPPGATRSNLLVATSASSAAQVLYNRRPGAAVSSFPTATSASPVAQNLQSHPIPQTSRHRVGSVPNRTDRSFHTPVSTASITATVHTAPVSTNIAPNRMNAALPSNATTLPPDTLTFPSGSANVTPLRTTREISSSTSRHRPEVIDLTSPERETQGRSANRNHKKTERPAHRSAPGPVSKSTRDNYNGGGPVRPAGQNGFDSADSLDGDVDTTDILPKRLSAPAQRATYQAGSKGKEPVRNVDNYGPFTHLDRKLPASTQSFDKDASRSFDRYATPSFERSATPRFERSATMTDPAPKPLHHEEIWSLKSPRTRSSTNNLNNSFFSQPDFPTSTSSNNNIALFFSQPDSPTTTPSNNNNIALIPAPASLLPPAHSSLPPKPPPTMAPTRPSRTAPKGPRGRTRGRPYQTRDTNNNHNNNSRGSYRGSGEGRTTTAAATDSTSHLLANARPEPAMYTAEWQLRQRASVPGCNPNNRFKEEKKANSVSVHDKITKAMTMAKRASAASGSGLGGGLLSATAGGPAGGGGGGNDGFGDGGDGDGGDGGDVADGGDAADGGNSLTDATTRPPFGMGPLSDPAADTGMGMGMGMGMGNGMGMGTGNRSFSHHQPNDMTFFRNSTGAVGASTGRDLSHGHGLTLTLTHEWPSTSSSRFGRLNDGGGSGVSSGGGGYGFGGNYASASASGFGNANNDNAAAATSPPHHYHHANQQQQHWSQHWSQHWNRSRPSRSRSRSSRGRGRGSRGRIESHSQSQDRRRPHPHPQGQPHSSTSAFTPSNSTSPFTTTPGTGTGTGTANANANEQLPAVAADTHRPTHRPTYEEEEEEEEYEMIE